MYQSEVTEYFRSLSHFLDGPYSQQAGRRDRQHFLVSRVDENRDRSPSSPSLRWGRAVFQLCQTSSSATREILKPQTPVGAQISWFFVIEPTQVSQHVTGEREVLVVWVS